MQFNFEFNRYFKHIGLKWNVARKGTHLNVTEDRTKYFMKGDSNYQAIESIESIKRVEGQNNKWMAVFKTPDNNAAANYITFGITQKTNEDPTQLKRGLNKNTWIVCCATGDLLNDG
jgi:hypothetical protein